MILVSPMPYVVLFWNIGQNRTNKAWNPVPSIKLLAEKFDVDVIALAEPGACIQEVQKSEPRNMIWFQQSLRTDKVAVIVQKGLRRQFKHVKTHSSHRISLFRSDEIQSHFAFVHLLDQRNHELAERNSFAQTCASWLRERMEGRVPKNLLVAGDFNLMPYDVGMVGAEGFHGVPTRHLARPDSRTVAFSNRRLLYNPTWSGLGDLSPGLPGSFGGSINGLIDPGWHAPDQFLVSQGLIDRVDWFKSGWRTERGSRRAPVFHRPSHDGSDHYPLLVHIR
ncbi:MAG: hypothetical protein EON58_11320 [Alphaproteobacteria bacterium]|nr:MAG: hypothetical protein EON58_11320 [Alphaproteobacteria bacterium]